MLRGILTTLGALWALPYTLGGLALGAAGLATGGGGRLRDGAIEFYGGAVAWALRHTLLGEATLALTLGHVILGKDEQALELTHVHERVHVRQFMVWGPLMGPAYLASSAWMWVTGRRAYLDNYFEREAYGVEGGDPCRRCAEAPDSHAP